MNKMMAMTSQRRSHDSSRVADHPRKRLPHHAPTGRGKDEEKRAQDLGEQPPPLLALVLEVFDTLPEALLVARDGAESGSGGLFRDADAALPLRKGCRTAWHVIG